MARRFVQICGALIALRSLTNFAKLFQGDDAVLVFFGRILQGGDAAVPAVVVGLFMLATGVGLLIGARWALPLVVTYAVYVAMNLVAWTVVNPEELVRVGQTVSGATAADSARGTGAIFFLLYAVVALATTAGPAWILWRRRDA